MRKLSLILAVSGLGVAISPAAAQDMPEEPPPTAATTGLPLSPEQQLAYEGWSPAQRADYDTWPADIQSIYWGLPEPRQAIFWQLSTNDRLALATMPEAERAAAWEMLEQRAAGAAPPTSESEPPLPDDKAE